jgi:hypothetical protein
MQANMSTADEMSTFIFSCIRDVMVFYGVAVLLLAALTQCYGCCKMRAVVSPA